MDKQTLAISKDKKSQFKLEFDAKLFQTKCGIEVEASSFTEKKLSYSLPGLHRYRGYELSNDFGYAWNVT